VKSKKAKDKMPLNSGFSFLRFAFLLLLFAFSFLLSPL